MGDKSSIEWTDATLNVVTGCTKVSAGCDHCYIERTPPFRMEGRRFTGTPPTTGVRLHPERLGIPLRWKRPRRIFFNSLSDAFHDEIPDQFVAQCFAMMAVTPQHTYQVLTKRPGRMASLLRNEQWLASIVDAEIPGYDLLDLRERLNGIAWPLPNVWLGTSVENQKWADVRIPKLLETPAAVRFLSAEPLLGPVDLSRWLPKQGELCVHAQRLGQRQPALACSVCSPLGWVIAGGESGSGARPMHPNWARSLRDQCVTACVPYFFKQWGEWSPARPNPYYKLGKTRMSHQSFCWTKEGTEYRSDEPDGWIGSTTVYRVGKHKAGRVLDGRTWDEYPA